MATTKYELPPVQREGTTEEQSVLCPLLLRGSFIPLDI